MEYGTGIAAPGPSGPSPVAPLSPAAPHRGVAVHFAALLPCFMDHYGSFFDVCCSVLLLVRLAFGIASLSRVSRYDRNSRLCHLALLPGTAPWQAPQKQRRPTSNAFKVRVICEKTLSQSAPSAEVSSFCTLQVYNLDRLDLCLYNLET